MTKTSKRYLNYSILIMLALIITRNLSASTLNNTAGLFITPVSKSIGVDVGLLTLTYSVASITRIIFLPIAGHLVNKYSMKILMIIAIIFQATGFTLLSIMDQVWQWYLCYIPIAMGGTILVSMSAPILINRWFKDKAASILGIVVAFYGIIGAFMQPLVINLIASIGWRKTYLYIGFLVGVIVLLTIIFFIKDKPKDLNNPQSINKTLSQNGITITQARKSISFYALIIFCTAMTSFAAFGQLMEPFGLSVGFSAKDMEPIISTSRIGNTIGALSIGFLAQKVGGLKTAIIDFILIIIAVTCLLLVKTNITLFYIGAFLLGFASMAIPILAPLLTASIFGHKNYSLIYSNIMMGPPLASVVAIPLYGFIFDQMQSYTLVLYLMFIFVIIAFIAISITWINRPKFQGDQL